MICYIGILLDISLGCLLTQQLSILLSWRLRCPLVKMWFEENDSLAKNQNAEPNPKSNILSHRVNSSKFTHISNQIFLECLHERPHPASIPPLLKGPCCERDMHLYLGNW
jgi:hypothetical protein